MSKQAYIIDGIRTPVGSFGGSLSAIRTDDLAAMVIEELVKRNPNIPTDKIDDVILGCHNQAGEDNRNVARMAGLLAGLPVTVPGETVNRLCSSGMAAIVNASRAIKAGDGDIFIAGGVEHMTRGPMVISKPSKAFGTDAKMEDSSFGWRFVNPKMKEMYGTDPMGITAENLVDMYNISREDQDKFALASQLKAAAAQENGRLAEEIMEVKIPQRKGDPILFQKDELPKIIGNKIYMSASNRIGIDELMDMIQKQFMKNYFYCELMIPYKDGAAYSHLKQNAQLDEEAYEEEGIRIKGKLLKEDYMRYEEYVIIE